MPPTPQLIQSSGPCPPTTPTTLATSTHRFTDAAPPPCLGPQLHGSEPAHVVRVVEHEAHHRLGLVHLQADGMAACQRAWCSSRFLNVLKVNMHSTSYEASQGPGNL